ncbi:DUF285 domain-containing protein [Campylobacter sp. RM12642]|nr:DUF285 domain-containing protein [Campylobacter sp. RM12642]MBZ8008102.1 DUF285 domain-containing protein [Campylobacter sp. RM9334]
MNGKYRPEDKKELQKLVYSNVISLSDVDTSLITDMSMLFNGSLRKDFSGINTWDTSNVTNMFQMFSACKYFNQSLNFDTSKVTNMQNMFYCCENFNQPLELDTSKVINMEGMLYGCKSFNQTLNFDTSKVENMSGMFEYCESLEHLPEFYKKFCEENEEV